ncbi:MAG: hypothetical protein ACYTFW_00585 [Planctomycetota bacterium]|jgi:hypothetical protein
MADKEIVLVEDEEKEDIEDKERIEKGYVPWGVTSFSALDEARKAAEAAERTYDLMTDFTGIVSNIIADGEIEDKPAAISKATKELEGRLGEATKIEKDIEPDLEEPMWKLTANAVIDWLKGILPVEQKEEIEPREDFLVWKQADGRLRWFTNYSNKFRDEDDPPEIISEKSHIRFEELVDTKQADMPELWLWHVPEWKFGVADWLAWDDAGFAVASGLVDEGKESVAEWIGAQKDVAVSHGMPKDSIMRDPDDPTIIVGHITREISPLPYFAAANKRTDYLILGNDKKEQEDAMAISDTKKLKLQESWNAPDGILERLEASNADKAQKAIEEEVDFKETEDKETEEVETGEASAEQAEQTESEAETEETVSEAETQPEAEEQEVETTDDADETQSEFPTRDEVVEAMTPMAKDIEALKEQTGLLTEAIKELLADDEEKVAKAAASTPPASIAALISKNMSVVGSEEAKIKGSEALAKKKPKEAETAGPTGIQFLDEILTQPQEQ